MKVTKPTAEMSRAVPAVTVWLESPTATEAPIATDLPSVAPMAELLRVAVWSAVASSPPARVRVDPVPIVAPVETLEMPTATTGVTAMPPEAPSRASRSIVLVVEASRVSAPPPVITAPSPMLALPVSLTTLTATPAPTPIPSGSLTKEKLCSAEPSAAAASSCDGVVPGAGGVAPAVELGEVGVGREPEGRGGLAADALEARGIPGADEVVGAAGDEATDVGAEAVVVGDGGAARDQGRGVGVREPVGQHDRVAVGLDGRHRVEHPLEGLRHETRVGRVVAGQLHRGRPAREGQHGAGLDGRGLVNRDDVEGERALEARLGRVTDSGDRGGREAQLGVGCLHDQRGRGQRDRTTHGCRRRGRSDRDRHRRRRRCRWRSRTARRCR